MFLFYEFGEKYFFLVTNLKNYGGIWVELLTLGAVFI